MLGFKRKKIDSNMLVAQERRFIINKNTDFFIHEAYNTLRSNVNFSLTDDGCKVIAVTSTNPSEGKSITALNLAIAFSEVDKKVLLFDGDLRKPKVHRLLEIDSKPGISNLLINECQIDEAIKQVKAYNIDVICSGDIPPNSTKLLESERFEKLLNELRQRYDIIIIDTPPINTVVDACIIAKYTSGIVYVIKQNYDKKDAVVNAVRQLEYAKGKVIGFVLNNIIDKNVLPFTYSYKYKYKNQYKYGYKEHTRKDNFIKETDPLNAHKSTKESQNRNKKKDLNRANKKSRKTSKVKKRKKRRVLIILLMIFIVIFGGIGTVAYMQRENIKALVISRQYSGEALNVKAQVAEKKTQELVESMKDVTIVPLSEDERKLLNKGEISKEYAMKILTGQLQLEKEHLNEDNPDMLKQSDSIIQHEVSKTNEIVAEIYLLKAEFLNNIDNLIAQGQEERHAIPKAERTMTVKLDMAKKYAKLGSELEAECDKEMDELLDELKKELQATGESISVIEEIKEVYLNEKAIKKAQLIDGYWPK